MVIVKTMLEKKRIILRLKILRKKMKQIWKKKLKTFLHTNFKNLVSALPHVGRFLDWFRGEAKKFERGPTAANTKFMKKESLWMSEVQVWESNVIVFVFWPDQETVSTTTPE